MSTAQQHRTKPQPLVNRLLMRVLRSPASRLVDRSLLLLTVTGRQSGRTYTFPAQYAEHDDTLWVYVGAGADKTWWRNLVDPAPVEVLLRRAVRGGTARAFNRREHRDHVEEGLRRYRDRYRRAVRRIGADLDDSGLVMVRIHLDPQGPGRPHPESAR